MLFKIGTSGYNYFWNEGKPSQFEWYLKQGFNTVEINATFYSFPFNSWINSWSKAPDYFDFSIKVNRIITHYTRLSEKGINIFKNFQKKFEKIKDKISFWLFQMPPTFQFNEKNLKKIENFFNNLDIYDKAVIEFRDISWWNDETFAFLEGIGVIFCSVDSPELPRDIIKTKNRIYLRLHGREEWYNYVYTNEELDLILNKIYSLNPKLCYIYLNNDTGMLVNGKYFLKKLNLK